MALPPVRSVGNANHVADHNAIAAALRPLADNGADPGDTGHWPDITGTARMARVRDRLLVGGGAGFSGNYGGSDNAYLLTARWLPVNSTAYVASQVGRLAVTGVTRANLSTTAGSGFPGQDAAIGVAGFARQDKLVSDATRNVFAWGGYFEAEQISAAQGAFGVEIDVGNEGTASAVNGPYNLYGINGTWGLVVASGGSTGASYNAATAGIMITNNGSTFKTGLIIGKNAIFGTDGTTGTGSAIEMAKGHVIQWSTPESTGLQGATLHSSVALNANRVGLEMTDSQFKFTRAGTTVFTVGINGGAGNYLSLLSVASGAGASPILIAESGSDSNVGIRVGPKGTGRGDLSGGAGVSKVAWNDTGLGFYNTTPIAKPTLAAAATDAATTQTLANSLRTTLINLGLAS